MPEVKLDESTLQKIRLNEPSLTDIYCVIRSKDDVANLFDAMKENNTLKSVKLKVTMGHADLFDDVLKALASVLRNGPAISLDLENMAITNAAITALASVLTSNIPNIISFSTAYIDEDGIPIFLNALKSNTTLRSLNLDCYEMSESGWLDLINTLTINKSLLSLDLSHASITMKAAIALADLLRSNATSLTSINLGGGNPLNTVSMMPITTAIRENKTLTSFRIPYDVFLSRVAAHKQVTLALTDALRVNTTLTSFHCTHRLYDNVPAFDLMNSYIKRNKILAALSLAAKKGDVIAMLSELVDLVSASVCPDIDEPDSTQPAEVIQIYRDCITLIPSMLSPNGVASLLPDYSGYSRYPDTIQAAVNKALAFYLFSNALPERVDQNRYRMIYWLSRTNLNDEDMWEINQKCFHALHGNAFSSVQQLLNIAKDGGNPCRDQSIILEELTLQMIRQNDLSTISFKYTVRDNAAAAALVEALKDNTNAESMTLILGDDDDNSAISLVDVLRNLPKHNSLKSITLSMTDEPNDEVVSLVNALQDMPADIDIPPTALDLSSTIVNSADMTALIDALRVNKTLLSLKLRNYGALKDAWIALAGLLRANAAALTSLELCGIGMHTDALIPLVVALKDNKTLTQFKVSSNSSMSPDWPAIIPLLTESLRVNTTLTSIFFSDMEVEGTTLLELMESFLTRNKILIELASAEENGDAIAIFNLLVQLQDACPDIDDPDSAQPANVTQAYRDYMILHPSTLSPGVVATLLTTSYSYFEDIQAGLEKALALYLFCNGPQARLQDKTAVSLPEEVDASRYRMILWLLRNSLNDEDMQEIIFMSAQALDANKNSLSSFNPSALSLQQLLNIPEDQDVNKIMKQDKKIILNQLRLLHKPTTTVAASAAVVVTSSGYSIFDRTTAASAAAIAESDKAKRKDKSHTTVKKTK